MSRISKLERKYNKLKRESDDFRQEFQRHGNTVWANGTEVGLADAIYAILDHMGITMSGLSLKEKAVRKNK